MSGHARFIGRAAGAMLVALALAQAATSGAARAAEPPAPAGDQDTLLRALRDELARSLEGLRLPDMEAPYFIEYAVEERREFKVTAVLGAVEKQESRSSRHLRAGVRVGSRGLDNSGFVSASFFSSGSRQALPVEDDYLALRRGIWLATDEAYKQALGQMAAKRAALQNRTREEIPDLSAEEPHTQLLPATTEALDEAAWTERVRALSAVYRAYPQLQDTGVSLRVQRVTRTYVNSEGTAVRRPADAVLLLIGALTQAADGQSLYTMLPVFQGSLADLPALEQLLPVVTASAERLRVLAGAPVAKRYLGPVLLAPQAAAELVSLTLLGAFSGERPPLLEDERYSAYFRPGSFSSRVGRRVLPEFLSVEDDPGRTALEGRALFGSYGVDDEGAPAQRVLLVEGGTLKSLLMSRRPGYGILRSNGHARAAGSERPRATPGNLIVTAADGRSLEELKAELLERCRKEGLEHALVITSLGLPPAAELESSLMAMMMGGGDAGLKIAAIAATRISVKDGLEEPVRGLLTTDLTPRALLDIVAAGSQRHVLNLLSADDGSVMGGIRSFAVSNSDEEGPGVPVSVAAPALLFAELEFTPSEAPSERLPLAPHPLAAQ